MLLWYLGRSTNGACQNVRQQVLFRRPAQSLPREQPALELLPSLPNGPSHLAWHHPATHAKAPHAHMPGLLLHGAVPCARYKRTPRVSEPSYSPTSAGPLGRAPSAQHEQIKPLA